MANEKILIVDDDIDTLKLVGIMLQRQGYQIMAANNGKKALRMVEEDAPDLILLDVMMPEMDGFEVARRLRANPKTANIPILMFTAKSQVDDKLAGFDAGADDYLTKPAHPAELLARVKKLLRPAHSTTPLAEIKTPRGWSIGLIGAKGGLGVSFVAINLGIVMHNESKEDVIIAEMRPGQGTIGMEIGHTSLSGLASVLKRGAAGITPDAISDALVSYLAGLRVLLASYDPEETAYATEVDALEAIAKNIRYLGRYIIFDLGASLQPATNKILPLCDEVIVVVDGYPNTVKMGKALVDYMMEHGVGQGRLSAVLVNHNRSDVQLAWQEVQKRLGIPVATVVPPVPEVAFRAQNAEKPVTIMQPSGLVPTQLGRVARQQIQKSK